MALYEEIVQRKAKIAVVGLGYVGMPLAVAFARHAEVIGFDVNADKIGSIISTLPMAEGIKKIKIVPIRSVPSKILL